MSLILNVSPGTSVLGAHTRQTRIAGKDEGRIEHDRVKAKTKHSLKLRFTEIEVIIHAHREDCGELFELFMKLLRNMIPMNINMLISVHSILLMKKAEDVHNFMGDLSLETAWGEDDLLGASDHS